MEYEIKLVPLEITPPSIESLDPDRRKDFYARRLGIESYKATFPLVINNIPEDEMFHNTESFTMRLMRRSIFDKSYIAQNVAMDEVDNLESFIWQAFTDEIITQDKFYRYLKQIPYQVLEHCDTANNTGVFTTFEIWRNREYDFWFLVGCIGFKDYVIAEWQSTKNNPLINFDSVIAWVEEGKYPTDCIIDSGVFFYKHIANSLKNKRKK